MPYFYDYLWHTLSKTQYIVWCGFSEDKSISQDASQLSCMKTVESLRAGYFVICVQYVPLFAMNDVIREANDRDRLWVFVSEQTSLSFNRDIYSKHARDYQNIRFIHYSDANVRHMHIENQTLDSRHVLLPFAPCSLNEFEKYHNREKRYDVAFVGHDGPYREAIVEQLRRKHRLVTVKFFGEQRDSLVADSKILINIHYNQQYRTLESLRCVMALLSGTLVVSENSTEQTLSTIEQQILFSNYDDLVVKVDGVLRRYEEMHAYLRTFLREYSEQSFMHCRSKFILTDLEEIKPTNK